MNHGHHEGLNRGTSFQQGPGRGMDTDERTCQLCGTHTTPQWRSGEGKGFLALTYQRTAVGHNNTEDFWNSGEVVPTSR